MIHFKKNLKGESNFIIVELYKKLNLHVFSARLVANLRYSQKCEGFYQFQHIDYKPAKKLIKPYLTHRDKIIRSNAYACYLSLVQGKLERIANIPTKISLLNMIKLMELLHIKKIDMPKNIDEWLLSENNSVIRLGIKMMVFFNYAHQEEKIVELLNSEDSILRYEAILACRKLYFKNAETELISIYLHDDNNNKAEILKGLKVIGGQKSLFFLEQLVLYETNKSLKMLAVNALSIIDKKAIEKLSLEDDDTLKMLNHINDIYIL
ncbi:HEAT repeat domain-containing protein [Flavobacterium sp. W22_SRS_FK3]|uniref:HEAT repeat domain-containing protein n=1 Tax=Flavobacterium sp. W22_SRS_FK3 TaxID=3240275 RepID=UPI003F8DA8D9